MQFLRRKGTGWFFTVTGFLACPCHLVVTLPLAVALLSGTTLGGWIATHEGGIALGATIYFVGALALGMTLLSMRRASAIGAVCATPAHGSAPSSAPTAAERPRTTTSGAQTLPRIDEATTCCQPMATHSDGRRAVRPAIASEVWPVGQVSDPVLPAPPNPSQPVDPGVTIGGRDA
jgi:hypothetical protein